MNALKVTLMLLVLVGCTDDAIKPATEISVMRNESINNTDVTVTIYCRKFTKSGELTIHLESEEEFNEFKQQVEFLLNKLEEVKRQKVISPPEKHPDAVSPVEIERIPQ